MINTIIFDRDWVIIDSEGMNIVTAVKTFEKLGIKILDEETNLVVWLHPADYIDYFYKKYQVDKDIYFKTALKIYENFFHDTQTVKKIIIKQMVKTIKELKNKSYTLAIATSSNIITTNIVLEETWLQDAFDTITTFDDCDKRKPYPDPYLISAKKLGKNPNECIVIEDSQIWLEAAKNAWMQCIIITTKYTKDQDFSKADYIISNPNEIIEILAKINKTV